MSLVSNFIINPVLRQARRFSSGFATDDQDPASLRNARTRSASDSTPPADNAIAEGPGNPDENGRPEGSSSSTTAPLSITPEQRRQNRLAVNARGTARRSALNHPTTPGSAPAGPVPSPRQRQLLHPGPSTPTSTGTWAAEANRSTPLPEDDGNGELRRRIIEIQQTEISTEEKARLVHELLMEGYVSRNGLPPTSPSLKPESPTGRSAAEPDPAESSRPLNPLKFWNSLGDPSGPLNLPLTEDDLTPTYVPKATPSDDIVDHLGNLILADDGEDQPKLGCEHYRRNVKMQCATCERWYTCRFCHDTNEDHVLPRKETKHMLCMLCGCPQKASDTCVGCGSSAANYFCGVCKLWNDDPNKSIYHCSDCGLCRVGQGLGRDFFHCKKCMACISLAGGHKCIERAVDCDCPICGDYLFNSPKAVVFMQCGHSIHKTCFYEHMQTSYKCPLCSKSCVNMESQFRQYDMAIASQPMPLEYLDARAIISCNDCSAKSQTTYHWLGLKCSLCSSYNTIQHQLLNMPGQEPSPSGGGATGRPILPPPASVEELGLPDLSQIRREMRLAARESERGDDRAPSPSPSVFARWFRSVSPAPPGLASASGSTSTLQPHTAALQVPSSPPGAGQDTHPSLAASSPSLPRPSNTARGPLLAGAAADHGSEEDDDDDLEEDMLDFWGRSGDEARGGAPISGEAEEEEESSSEESSDGGEEEEDDDEEEIVLFGHR